MTNSIAYILEVTLVFSVFYLLYKIVLERHTFYKLNRLVLLLILPASLCIPLSSKVIPSLPSKIIDFPFIAYVNVELLTNQLQVTQQPIILSSFNFISVLFILYVAIFLVKLIRLWRGIRYLMVLKRRSEIKVKENYQLVIAEVPEIFSYFKWIFVPKSNSKPYDTQIIAHEKMHIQLKHSWDVVVTELYITLFWCNPLLYLYRASLKSVHEFQADEGVLNNGIKTSEYMELLLQNLEVSKPNTLYSYFNQSILKQRVIMMTKPKSNRIAKLKYIVLLPVCVMLISAFTSPTIETPIHYLDVLTTSFIETSPPSLFPVQNASQRDILSHFGKRAKHPTIKKIVSHKGIDIKAAIGTPVLATADGKIAKASMEGNWGNLIIITHLDGYETWYAHLDAFNSRQNQLIKKGDVIGYVGNTGLSSRPHLHYEVKRNGQHLNPLHYVE